MLSIKAFDMKNRLIFYTMLLDEKRCLKKDKVYVYCHDIYNW